MLNFEIVLLLSFIIALTQSTANAQSPSNFELEEISVIGTKTEKLIDEVPATVTVIREEKVNREIVRDISDLIRYEPGVSVSGTGSRFGLSGFNIRGIEGDRIQILIDGIRTPDEFASGGPFLDSRRDFVDIDLYTVVDLLGYTTVKENFSLSFGHFNIFDKQYLRWADTAFMQTGSAFQRYTQPGFHGGINLKYTM